MDGNLKIVRRDEIQLSKLKCYLLIVAGGYSHFLLDFLFDCNGYCSTYRWVISTGSWNDTAYFDVWIIIPALLTTAFIILFLYFNNPPDPELNQKQLKKSGYLLFVYAILYLIYLGIRLRIGVPAIGEEADFGVVIFLTGFLFFPIFLCILSTKELLKKGHSIKDEKRR